MTFWDVINIWVESANNPNIINELALDAGFSPHRFSQIAKGENLTYGDCAKFARWVNSNFSAEFGIIGKLRFCDIWPNYIKPPTREKDFKLFAAIRALKGGTLAEADVEVVADVLKKKKIKPDSGGNYNAQEVFDAMA